MVVTGRAAPLAVVLWVLGGLCSASASHSVANSSVNNLSVYLSEPTRTEEMEDTPSFELVFPSTSLLPSTSLSEQAPSATLPDLLLTPSPASQTASRMVSSSSTTIAVPFSSRSVGVDMESSAAITPSSSSLRSSSLVDSGGVVSSSSAIKVVASSLVSSSETTSSTEDVSPTPSTGTPSCPGEDQGGIHWPATTTGTSVNVNCSDGTASRHCSPDGIWRQPDLFDCLTPEFLHLRELLPSGPAPTSIAMVTMLANEALNATVTAATRSGPVKLTAKDVKVLLDALSFIAEWSTNQSSPPVSGPVVKTSLMAVDNVLDVNHQSFWRRVSGSPNEDVADLPLQLLRTTEALALRLAAVDTVGDSGGTEKGFVMKQLGMAYGLYDLHSNRTLRTPLPAAFNLTSFLGQKGSSNPTQAIVPPEFVYDRLHGNDVPRSLAYVYLVVKGVSQYLPCDTCNSSNLIGPPVSHVTSLQLDVKLGCPRKSQVRLEGFPLDDDKSHFKINVSVTPRCVFYNYTDRSWSTYAVKTRHSRAKQVVTCLTHHLTGFAVTQEQQEYTIGNFAYFVYVGSGVLVIVALFGVAALLCTCCLGCQLCKKIHNLIHLNLVVSMAASGLALIFGMHPIIPIQTVYYDFDLSPSTVCTVSSAVIHFCVTSSFVWLMCEAILLVAMVTKLNSSCIGCGCCLFVLSWILPAAPVVVAVVLFEPLTALNYDGQLVCWPTSEWKTELVLWVPIAVFSILSVVLATVAAIGLCLQRKQLTMTEGNNRLKTKFSQLKIMTVGVYILLPCMLVSWALADLMFQFSSTIVIAALFLVTTPVQAFVLVVVFICRNNFCKSSDGSQSPLSDCCRSHTSSSQQADLWAEEQARPTPKVDEAVKTSNGASLAECTELKRHSSGISTTSVTFTKRPIYVVTPVSNQDTGSNSGDSITGADVDMVTYTPLRSVDAQYRRNGANGKAELLAVSPYETEMFANTGVDQAAPRADRSGTETSV